jgi:hypothetical protein
MKFSRFSRKTYNIILLLLGGCLTVTMVQLSTKGASINTLSKENARLEIVASIKSDSIIWLDSLQSEYSMELHNLVSQNAQAMNEIAENSLMMMPEWFNSFDEAQKFIRSVNEELNQLGQVLTLTFVINDDCGSEINITEDYIFIENEDDAEPMNYKPRQVICGKHRLPRESQLIREGDFYANIYASNTPKEG